MKTAKTKTPAVPVVEDVVEEREPTDAELRALEVDAAEAVAEAIGSTPVDLARLGLNQVAYVRRSIVDDQPIWSIHSAAGHPLGAAPTFEQAWGAVVQNELVPMYVN